MIVINSLGQIKQPVGGGAAATAISGIGASNSTYTSGTVIFSNQANITIGTSVDGASQYVRLSAGAGGGGGAALSAGTQSVNTGTVLFADSNGLTFGMSGSSRITGSYTVPSTAGLISYVNLSAGATSNNSSPTSLRQAPNRPRSKR